MILSTCLHTNLRTIIPIASKMTVDRMKGKSELTNMPHYLTKDVCQSLAATINKLAHLRQYYEKQKINDEMQPGWEDP